MSRARILWVLCLASCAGSKSPASSPPEPRPGCEVVNAGPLIGYSYRDVPPPASQAGAIRDGTYDLVEIVTHTSQPGEWSSNMAPAFRWTMRFSTTETSPNHTAGVLASSVDMPPAVACNVARFATFQRELRVEGGSKGIDAVGYTAQGDVLSFTKMDGDGGDPQTYVFRRRL
jgi:hypothetical protein